MFIGHFAFAYVLIRLFPGVLPMIPLLGVDFPDLLWPFLIISGIEKVSIDPESPLQNHIKFTSYPYSHSLVLGTLIACVVGLGLAYFTSPLAGLVFVAASASHWLLDATVHLKDLPVLGFGPDRKFGFGLWNRPKTAFIIEYLFYAVLTALTFPSEADALAGDWGYIPPDQRQLLPRADKDEPVQISQCLCNARPCGYLGVQPGCQLCDFRDEMR